MNWDAVGATAEAIGALAVIVTLAYLAIQLRQQNSVARAQVQQQRADSVIQLVNNIYTSKEVDLFTKVVGNTNLKREDFSESEQFRVRLILSPVRANLENTFEQYRSGFITEEHFQDVTIPLCITFARPILEFRLPLTRSFKKELIKVIQSEPPSIP